MAHVEVGLAGGKSLAIIDRNTTEDEVVAKLSRAADRDYVRVGGFVPLQTTEGPVRVNPQLVVYVRSVG